MDELIPIIALITFLGLIFLSFVVWIKIFTKAGFPRVYGFLMMVPIVNLVLLLILAFGKWPIHDKIDQNK